MNWIPIGGGGAVVVLLVAGIAWRTLRARGGRIDSPEEAAAAAEGALRDFAAHNAVVGVDGAAALVVGDGARLAVLKCQGAKLAVREIGWTDVRSTPEGIIIETRERAFGTVALAGVDVLDVRRLAPQLTRV